MRLAGREHALLDELLHLPDPQERLAAVVDRTRRKPRLTSEERSPVARVPGCSSSVWLVCELREGRCYFRTDADSPVVRGLVGLLADFFSDARPAEIAVHRTNPLDLLDLSRMLTPTRRHGLAAVLAAIHQFALEQLPPRSAPPRE
jgi:cysteine desulfuration protein SufE